MMATRCTIMYVLFSHVIIPTAFVRYVYGQSPIITEQQHKNLRRLRFVPFTPSEKMDFASVIDNVDPRLDDLDLFDEDDLRSIAMSMPTNVPSVNPIPPGQTPTPIPPSPTDGPAEKPSDPLPVPPGDGPTPTPTPVPPFPTAGPVEKPTTPTPPPIVPPTGTPVTPRPTSVPSNRPTSPPPSSPPPTSPPPSSPPTASPTTAQPTANPTSITEAPADPPTREDREVLIFVKCGVTALERSRDILAELLTVSSANTLVNPETPQYQAREWIDNIDPAIICPSSPEQIHQRYRVSLLYYEMGGNNWTQCSAVDDDGNNVTDPAPSCPGIPFLDVRNECEWYGLSCGEGYDPGNTSATVPPSVSADVYFPLKELVLPSNNLVGTLFDELYGFEELQRLNLQGNGRIGGTISDEIIGLSRLRELDLGDNSLTGPLPTSLFDLPSIVSLYLNDNKLSGIISNDIGELRNVTIVQLQYNSFDGPVPEEGLFLLERLVGLSIQGNELVGSLEGLCNVVEERREQFDEYLTILDADCGGTSPPVECSCCMCF